MSKGHDESDKHPEKQVEKHKEPVASKEGSAGEGKKHGEAKKPDAPRSTKKGHEPLPDACHAWGCKAKSAQFNFCAEHFDHFKFGLIKKTGEPVPDYEKKIEHFMAYKAKKSAQRVA